MTTEAPIDLAGELLAALGASAAAAAAEAEDVRALDGTDVLDEISQIRALDVSIALLKSQRTLHIDNIKDLLGEAVTGTVDSKPVAYYRWKNRTTLNAPKLREISEDLFNRVSKSTRYRDFRLAGE